MLVVKRQARVTKINFCCRLFSATCHLIDETSPLKSLERCCITRNVMLVCFTFGKFRGSHKNSAMKFISEKNE